MVSSKANFVRVLLVFCVRETLYDVYIIRLESHYVGILDSILHITSSQYSLHSYSLRTRMGGSQAFSLKLRAVCSERSARQVRYLDTYSASTKLLSSLSFSSFRASI